MLKYFHQKYNCQSGKCFLIFVSLPSLNSIIILLIVSMANKVMLVESSQLAYLLKKMKNFNNQVSTLDGNIKT